MGISIHERDFFVDRLSESELKELFKQIPAASLFSWRSPSAKLFRPQRDRMSEDKLLKLMAEEPRLIRRPILIFRDRRPIIGFDRDDYSALDPTHTA